MENTESVISHGNNEVNPKYKTSSDKLSSDNTDQFFIEKAFEYAHDALKRLEVPVGCIFVYNNKIIASGRNMVNETRNACRHAELVCIDQAIEYAKLNSLPFSALFENICVYVTVEPCIMCISALFDLNVKKIMYGCKNDRFGGVTVCNVASIMKHPAICCGGYKADVALDLLKQFYKGENPNAPPSKVKKKN